MNRVQTIIRYAFMLPGLASKHQDRLREAMCRIDGTASGWPQDSVTRPQSGSTCVPLLPKLEAVLTALQERGTNGAITAQMAGILNVSTDDAYQMLARLKARGCAVSRHLGPRGPVEWRITEEGDIALATGVLPMKAEQVAAE